MVRKWSYLENSTLPIGDDTFRNSTNLYHFKVFRKTTRFKKFNRGTTKMVRKNYARRKHRTNWFILSHITKVWVLSYLKMRQFERFFSSITCFRVCAFTSDISIFLLKLNDVSNKLGLNVISCSKAQLKRYSTRTNKTVLLNNPTSNTINTMVQASSIENVNNSLEIFPNLATFEGSSYPLENYQPDVRLNLNTALPLMKSTNSITSSMRSTLVLLTLYNTKRD